MNNMNNFLDKILLLHNDITVVLDYSKKTLLKALKANKVLLENCDFKALTDWFCYEEELDEDSADQFEIFLDRLNLAEGPFSLEATYLAKTTKEKKRYRFRGYLDNQKVYLIISRLNKTIVESFDVMTKVYTREVVIKKIQEEIDSNTSFALIIMDIDNFKYFNDAYGHMYGDLILTEVAACIKSILEPGDFIGRIGGDEFLICIHTPNNSYEEIHAVCSKIKIAIQNLSKNNIKKASVTATFGCAIYPTDAYDYDTLFKKADKALYRGKKKGRNCFIIYSRELCGDVGDFKLQDKSGVETIDQNSTNGQIIIGALELLNREGGIKKNIYDVLSLLGNFFLIERINLYVTNLINEDFVNVSWIDNRSKEKYDGLVETKLQNHDVWLEEFDQTGMIKYNQIKNQPNNRPFINYLIAQKTCSLLAFKLEYKEKEIGILRFDTCKNNKFWQAPDVSALMVISKIMAIFINKENEQALINKYIFYDNLTGLYTYEKFRSEVAQKRLQNNNAYAVLQLDIQNFENINVSYGPELGDLILVTLSKAIRSSISAGDLYCRVIDEKFILYFENTDVFYLKSTFDTITNKVSTKFADYPVIIRGGIYIANENDDLNDSIEKAHTALKSIMTVDSSTSIVFDTEIHEKYVLERAIISHMYKAIEDKEFLLYLQPKVEIKSGKLYGAEALSRWNFKNKQILYPPSYVPVFERIGFVNNLDYYIFEQVCAFLKDMKDANKELISVSVNVSRYQTNIDSYTKNIERIREKYGVDSKYIEIEINEGMYVDDVGRVALLVNKLHSLGYQVSMDDFGSGYSNLAQLAKLNFDVIKLDRSLVSQQNTGREKPILTFIRQLTSSLNVNVLCEGVENEQVANLLNSLGYQLGQGYLYDKPIPAEEFKKKYLN